MASGKLKLRLRPVPAAAGPRWVRQGVGLWARHPLALGGLFVAFVLGVMLVSALLPLLGGVLALGALPLLTLAYVLAGREATQQRPVRLGLLVQGLRDSDAPRRRALVQLCGVSMGTTLVALWLADWVDGGAFRALQEAVAQMQAVARDAGPAAEAAARQKLVDAWAQPGLAGGMLVRLGLTALASVPLWHAPPLVHFAGQSAGQAMFSSTVAVWRARGAFTLYALGWFALAIALGLVAMMLARGTGGGQLAAMLLMPLALGVSSAFYSSLWFVFVDSFAVDSQRSESTIETP